MTWGQIVVTALCLVLVILPAQYDPAVRLKKHLMRKRKDKQ